MKNKWWKDPKRRKLVGEKISKAIRKTPNLNRPIYDLIRECYKYRVWRHDILRRDNWTCQNQLCNKRGKYKKDNVRIEVHHLNDYARIIKGMRTLEEAENCVELWDITNGICLCRECHKSTDNHEYGYSKKNRKVLDIKKPVI